MHPYNDNSPRIGLPLVLLHGDAGPHNMFFKKNPDSSPSSEVSAFIDWQIAFKGALALPNYPSFGANSYSGNQFFDIARNIYGFADAEARREAEKTLLEDYYEVYKDGLSMEGRSVAAELAEVGFR